MKKFKKQNLIKPLMLVFMFVGLLSSCSEEEENDMVSSGPPVIESVSRAEAGDLTPITIGYANNMYIIQGSGFASVEKIYFNDTDTYFNPALVTDNTIFVTIDQNTPYENASSILKVVTANGTVTYQFVVAPPAPQVTRGFQPVNANEGDQVTIYGNFFLDPIVTFGSIEATIVSNTLTEIVAIVPAGAQNKYLTVTTISGESSWGTAVGTSIYDDNFYGAWDIPAWNNHEYLTDPENAYQGKTFIHKEISGWDNIQSEWIWDDQISAYTGVRFAVKSDTPGTLIFLFNGNYWGDETRAFDTTTEWQVVSYSWEELGGMPDGVQNISFQEFSGESHNYYFDDFSYTVD